MVAPGGVVGLVGPNGAGKSTLLRILAGARAPDDGAVAVSPPPAQLGYLAQEVGRRPDESVRAHLERRTGVGPRQAARAAA
ncbi:ATP-binding cassette domain-containing protein, partial [Cellulomonas sp. GbtcB1]|uniref:ATP-binding cassette domain-containing protein n=1 Tax=Cellulomonas sp. GbtcB1 TaxID=2824746 RepID=UPI0027DF67ED